MDSPVIDAPVPPAAAQAGGRTFIRATEVWVPGRDRQRLELASGLYDGLGGFEAVARGMTFGHGEGLPGRAWEAGHPIVLKDLAGPVFLRSDAAAAAGLTCGVAIPIFAGSFLMAVLVLFCGDDRDHVGAVEIWNAAPDATDMGLADGYFGSADVFEWSARHTRFPRGAGLPGRVWETGLPVVMPDLGRSRRFLRWESAERVGINRGVGIPCGSGSAGTWVLALLSALGTPIARRVETWTPGPDDSLTFAGGFCEQCPDLAAVYAGHSIPAGVGTVGQVARTGVPAISTAAAAEPAPIADSLAGTGLGSLVAMPVIDGGRVVSVVVWYL